jgi:FlaA1/EpsC-like NDP-sugar epimerase
VAPSEQVSALSLIHIKTRRCGPPIGKYATKGGNHEATPSGYTIERKTAIGVGILLAVLVTLLTGVGAYLSVRWDSNGPFIVVVVATMVISFVSLLALAQVNKERWELTESTMRTAIAGTIVIAYLVLVGIVAFFTHGPEKLPAISEAMVTNFTTIVGVVVAFYFGASAYVQASSQKQEKGQSPTEEKK